MPQFLLLRLEGPLLAFGGEAVDAYGVISDFPGASMLTGLLANALGWQRSDRERLARLQQRLTFAARIDREGERIRDFQTAALGATDKGWTTRGRPEGRAGGAGTYKSPHIRRRDYDGDKAVTVALRLTDETEQPTIEQCATALQEPVRPLFLGRKSCPPSGHLLLGLFEVEDLAAALRWPSLAENPGTSIRVMEPLPPGTRERVTGTEDRAVTDERDWRSGVHGGRRIVRISNVPASAFGQAGTSGG
jgi:CRISPR system Cascade subunit CasD